MTSLQGVKVLVTAGPTYEDIDPARFIGNRSSGKMGFAIADVAAQMGADVTLVAGPVNLVTPQNVNRVDVRSAEQMYEAVMANLPATFYIGAAAVADFRPKRYASIKIKKQDEDDGLILELEQTKDILKSVANHPQRPQLVCGFAAETHDIENYAQGKLDRKNLDLIAANRVGIPNSGFESDNNAITVFSRFTSQPQTFGTASKSDVARMLLEYMAQLHSQQQG